MLNGQLLNTGELLFQWGRMRLSQVETKLLESCRVDVISHITGGFPYAKNAFADAVAYVICV